MHKPEERPDFTEINEELQSKVRTVSRCTIHRFNITTLLNVIYTLSSEKNTHFCFLA